MEGPSHQWTEEEIQFVFDSLGWNYSPLCGVKGPPVPAPGLAFTISLHPFNLQPLAQHLYISGQYINRGKNKVTKYPSIKISYTGNYLFL